jgi:hypothetical protein
MEEPLDARGIDIAPFLNGREPAIGRTVSTRLEPNTSSRFHFWVSAEEARLGRLEIGSILAAVADDDDEITFGTITEMRSYSDVDSFIADYLSHDFGGADIQVPTDIEEVLVVTCASMRSLSLKTKPVGRSRVYFPSELGIQYSYGIVNERGENIFEGNPIPIGVFENADGTIAPISVDEAFVVGPEGAHLNVSGISGLAAKTSAVEFVIASLLRNTGKRVAVVMFNVKSKDLLYIDRANPRLEFDGEIETWSRGIYEALEIPTRPFEGARFFAPADPADPNGAQTLRQGAVESFQWDLSQIVRDIPGLFDPMDWDDRMEGAWFVVEQAQARNQFVTYAQMLAWLDNLISTANARNRQWHLSVHIATWSKLRFHLQRFPRAYRGLIATAGAGHDIPWSQLASGTVFVVDIQALNSRGQRLAFGRAIRSITDMLEGEEGEVDAVVVFVDELNKFAPSGNVRTPLKSHLIDVTARGRSIGMVLFGAEQFSSSVEREIVENSATYLFGRTESNELRSPAYSGFSDEVKTKLTMLPQGSLLAKFAKFPQPIFVRFPLPPCMPGDQAREV